VIKSGILPAGPMTKLAKKAPISRTPGNDAPGHYPVLHQSPEDLHRSAAQKKLLDGLLAELDFPLPPSMVDQHLAQMLEDYVNQLERRGKSVDSTGKTLADIKVEMTPRAEELVRTQIFLSAVAAKEELSVGPQEMDAFFYRLSTQTGQDVILLKRYYEDNNLMVMVRDKLLADKAADFIYANAEVTKVPQTETPTYGVRD